MRVFCLPHAGGSAAIFARWPARLPEAIDLWAVELPGRGRRLLEAPLNRLPTLVGALADAITPHVEKPFALFGHSMGALVAFELARELRRRALPAPCRLIVAAFPAPHLLRESRRRQELPDDELLGELKRLGGTPEEALRDPELMALYLPVIRADLALCESYRHSWEPPLACAVTALGGTLDELVGEEMLAAWRLHTSDDFRCHQLPGEGHFFVETASSSLIEWVADATLGTAGLAARGGGGGFGPLGGWPGAGGARADEGRAPTAS